MNKLIAVMALLFSSSVMAVGIGNDNPPSEGSSTTVTVKPVISNFAEGGRSDSSSRARAEAYAASLSASKSNAVASGGVSSATNVSSPTQTSTNSIQLSTGGFTVNSNYEALRNTPAVTLGGLYPSASCHGTSNVGGSGYGWGFGFGSSWSDDDCQIRETSRSFLGLGLKDDAVSVLCSSKYASVAPVCKPKE